MKKFFGIFLFLFVSGLFSNINSSARPNTWPPIFSFTKKTSTTTTSSKSSSNIITGLATYYASKFEGNLTATGEVFHHCNLTAASNFFALNTWVKVTNLLTGKSIIVRINDRMHPSMSQKGRILDLTMTGAKQLKIVNRGIAKVKIEAVSKDVATAN
ncbi:MAG: septal ring lytic transglycosylase RlpA family protein [Parafilimonas sp.]|nr:septal ring lytic transglycosylase RlpA family protein [Parafilimonas sp.]